MGRELSEVLSWAGPESSLESTRGWVGPGAMSKVPMAGPTMWDALVCPSVCPGENYKALEAPADGFARHFFGSREGGNTGGMITSWTEKGKGWGCRGGGQGPENCYPYLFHRGLPFHRVKQVSLRFGKAESYPTLPPFCLT